MAEYANGEKPQKVSSGTSTSGGSGKVRGVPQSFGYVKRHSAGTSPSPNGVQNGGKDSTRTAQVSAVPRTKVRVITAAKITNYVSREFNRNTRFYLSSLFRSKCRAARKRVPPSFKPTPRRLTRATIIRATASPGRAPANCPNRCAIGLCSARRACPSLEAQNSPRCSRLRITASGGRARGLPPPPSRHGCSNRLMEV